MRIGINGSDRLVSPDLSDLVTGIAAAEASGFSSYWLAQNGQTYHLGFSSPGYCPITREVSVGTGPETLDVAMVQPTPAERKLLAMSTNRSS